MDVDSAASVSRSKRKFDCSDSIALLLHDFSLSPRSKRLYQDFGSTSSFTAAFSPPNLPKETIGCGSSTSDFEFSEESPDEAEEELSNESEQHVNVTKIGISQQPMEARTETNDQKAIVLYKPVIPPLFPGGPIAGLQISLNGKFLSAGMKGSPGLLADRKDDRWLQSPNNTDLMEMGDPMEDDEDWNSDKRSLAVIPWVNNPPKFVEYQVAEFPKRAVEDMEEDSGLSMGSVENPVTNLNSNYRFEPWQHYGVPQSHYSPAMWSH